VKRRHFLAGTAVTAALVAGCSGSDPSPAESDDPTDTPGSDPTTTEPPTTEPPTTEPPTTEPMTLANGSFESGLDGWTIEKDLPADPNNPEKKVDSGVDVTPDRASDGDSALWISIDGSADDGTVWVQQEVDLSEVSTLAVDGYSEQTSFNTVLEVSTYAGPVPEDGLAETDFTTEHSLWDHEGWKTYEYDVDHDGRGLVAVGLNIIWETGAAGILDNVRLE